MNGWQCEYPGCPYKCVGVNGAMGLRAIGWYFVPGLTNNCFCPYHHPKGMDQAIKDGREIQTEIYKKFDIENPYA